jgi:hypothetical protein
VLPSTAALAGVPAFSVEDAVAGRFRATLVVPHAADAVVAVVTKENKLSRVVAAAAIAAQRRLGSDIIVLPVGF